MKYRPAFMTIIERILRATKFAKVPRVAEITFINVIRRLRYVARAGIRCDFRARLIIV